MYITYFFKFFIHSTLKYILIKPENHWIDQSKQENFYPNHPFINTLYFYVVCY